MKHLLINPKVHTIVRLTLSCIISYGLWFLIYNSVHTTETITVPIDIIDTTPCHTCIEYPYYTSVTARGPAFAMRDIHTKVSSLLLNTSSLSLGTHPIYITNDFLSLPKCIDLIQQDSLFVTIKPLTVKL